MVSARWSDLSHIQRVLACGEKEDVSEKADFQTGRHAMATQELRSIPSRRDYLKSRLHEPITHQQKEKN
nr:unnamed protein product [Callosobruchus chinensis]